uniref:Uncharacterized protein n=1 Tax=Arundo donax TaxID=35708 RepID=A0A0A9F9K3_ARUDO
MSLACTLYLYIPFQ